MSKALDDRLSFLESAEKSSRAWVEELKAEAEIARGKQLEVFQDGLVKVQADLQTNTALLKSIGDVISQINQMQVNPGSSHDAHGLEDDDDADLPLPPDPNRRGAASKPAKTAGTQKDGRFMQTFDELDLF